MRAAFFDTFAQSPAVTEVDAPLPPPHGAVISVEATGLCRSDWHAWAGHDETVSLPHVPGHEFVGTVARVGADVTDFSPGDRVTAPFVSGCGECEFCRAGNAQVCPDQTQPGFTHWGSWAEEVRIDHADVNLVRLPEGLPAEAVVSLGCRFATAFRGLHSRARVQAGETVAVFGCGGVGLSAVMIAAAMGARVIAVDVSTGALEIAQRMGALEAVNTTGLTELEAASAVRSAAERLGAAHGAHVSVEALGLPATMNAGLHALAPLGRHVQIGLFAQPPVSAVPVVIARELSLLGSHGMSAADYPPLLDLVTSGKLRPQDLVTRTLTLEEAPAALVAMNEGTLPGLTLIRP